MVRKSPKKPRKSKRKTYADDPVPRSLRLTFRYEGNYIELLRARRVSVVAPPSDTLGKLKPLTGFCFELLTARNRVLYRRFGENPIETSIEVPSGDVEKPFVRQAIEKPHGEFSLLVPVIDKAVKITLVSDAHHRKSAPMESVATFELTDLPFKESR